MVSFGIGSGQFLQGASQGLQQGQQLRSQVEDGLINRKMRKVEKTARGEADAAREADISKGITTTLDPVTGGQTYKVGATDFGTDSKAARDAAAKQVGSFTEYYMKTAVPQLVDGYMRAGKPQLAQQYQTWMETAGAKQGLKHWATAARAASRGDTGQFIKSMQAAYNTPGYYDDGVNLVGGEEIKDKDGNVTGIRMKFKGADGKEYAQEYQGMEDVYRQGVMVMSPEAVFQQGMADVKAAQAVRAEAIKAKREFGFDIAKQNNKGVIDDRLDDRQFQRTLRRDAFQHGYQMEQDNNSAAVRAAYRAEDEGDETPAATRKQLESITKRLAETDLRFSKLSPEEQTARAVAELQRQRAAARGITPGGSSAVSAPGAPALY